MTEARSVRLLRGLSGLLAGGLVALVLALVGAWFLAEQLAVPGPTLETIAGHAVAAVVAVLVQRQADRRRDRAAVIAALTVLLVTAVVLTVQWLA
jgi:putative effector of murein hydrolase